MAEAKASSIDVYAAEDAADPDRQIVSGVDTSVDTIPIVFFVKDREPDADRLEVYLPVRPNGSSGWVDASRRDGDRHALPDRGRHLASTGSACSATTRSSSTSRWASVAPTGPTPGGIYYLKELLQPPNPNGPYGVYAYGLSGFSNVLAELQRRRRRDRDPRHQRARQASAPTCRAGASASTTRPSRAWSRRSGCPLGTPVEIQA